MTTIYHRESLEHIEEGLSFDLQSFAQACGQSSEWVLRLLEYEILPRRPEERIHQFFVDDLVRAQQAYRLQRDFDASFSAVAMMLDLIDEVQHLRKQVKHCNFIHS